MFGLILGLAGCAERFSKPGATQLDLDRDYQSCKVQAFSAFPYTPEQIQLNAGYYEPMSTVCSGYGAFTNCSTVGGEYVAPTYLTVDGNLTPRHSMLMGCMEGLGYTSEGLIHAGGGPLDIDSPVLTTP